MKLLKPSLVLAVCLFVVSDIQAQQKGNPQPPRPTSEMENVRRRQDQAMLKGAHEKELRQELEALNLILGNKLRKDGKNELLLRRAFIYYKIGRSRLLAQPGSKTPKAHFFREATAAVNELVSLSKNRDIVLTKSQQALLLFIRGSVSQELMQEKNYMDDFSLAIKLDPKLPQSPSMALILGETYFEKEKYKDAIAWYQKLKTQYDPHQKSIADFKTGWAWLLLKEEKNAQFYFLRVANQVQSESFREDSVRALAFITSQNRSERWIVEFSRKSIVDEKLRLLYLSTVIQNIHSIDKTKVPYLLFSELYKRTKDPAAKIKVLGQLIAFERREIPTLGQKRAFEYLETLVRNNPQLSWKKWMTEVLDLETDLRSYIQILADHYVGKLPAKLTLQKEQIVDLLNREIQFYITYLMTDSTRKPMLNLWLDLIHREQNREMAQKAVEMIKALQPPATGELRRARLEYIAIIDTKMGDSPDLRKLLIAEIEDFTTTYAGDNDKSRLLTRLSELYMLDGQFEKALPALHELYKIQPTEGHAYNVLWSQFKMEKFAEVVASDMALKFRKAAKVQEVLRESHLKLAQEAQKSGDQAAYEKHLREFLALNPKSEQSSLVKSSLLASYLEKKNLDAYCKERAGMSDKERSTANILETEERALDMMFLDGPLLNCHWSTKKGPVTRDFKLVLFERSKSKSTPKDFEKSISKFGADQLSVLLSLLAITHPKEVIKMKPPGTGDDMKAIFWMALQLAQGKASPTLPPNLQSLLKDRKAAVKDYKTTSSIFKIVSEATFPGAKMSVEKYSKYLEDLIYRSKLVKTKFAKEAPDLADETKRDVLEKAAGFERKIGESIRNSPVPGGLKEEEITGYKGELDKAAADFDRQAEEYDKALGDLKAQLWMREQDAAAQAYPDMNADKWFWEGDERAALEQTLKQDGAFYMLLKLETNRAAKTLSDLDYIRRRAGALLMLRQDEIMKRIVREELFALRADSLLEKWKGLK